MKKPEDNIENISKIKKKKAKTMPLVDPSSFPLQEEKNDTQI
jgi:hypothetical protein